MIFSDLTTMKLRYDLRAWSRICCAVALFIATVVLAGWVWGTDLLVRLRPDYAAMVPATAASLAGLSLALLLLRAPLRFGRVAALALALPIGLHAVYHLSQLFAILAEIDPRTDRMSIATSIGVTLLSIGILAAMSEHAMARTVQSWMGTVGTVLALIVLDGYLFDAPALFEFFVLSATALHTAFCLLLVFLALLFDRPQGTWIAVLFADTGGSRRALRVLPLAVLGPILLSYAALWSTQHGFITPNLRLGVIAIALAGLGVYSLIWTARHYVAEEAAREAQRLREILDGLEAAVFVFNAEGALRLVNRHAEELTAGASTPDAWLRGTTFHTLGDRRRLDGEAHPAVRLLDLGQKQAIHAGWLDDSGAERALRFVAARPEPVAQNRPIIILTVVDETEGWRLRENLARSERMEAVDQMAGGIAHEMSNILGVLQLSIDTGLLTVRDGAERDRLDTMGRACARGAELTARLLNLTRDKTSDDHPVDASSVAEQAAALARRTLPANMRLVFDPAPGPTIVICDALDLESALLNLVINARNALSETDLPEPIRLGVTTENGTVCITVTDRGPGMRAEIRDRATEPFFTTRGDQGGTGLGLAMVDSFARRCGGTLRLDSTPGAGTTASILLPVAAALPASSEATAGDVASLADLHILVVEDDPQFLEILPDALAALGAEVRRTADAEAALAMLDSDAPVDLLLSDILLPGPLDGYALARRARVIRPNLRVIYLSGFTDPAHRSDTDPPGLLLRKPVRLRTLCNAIALVAGRHMQDAPAESAGTDRIPPYAEGVQVGPTRPAP